MSETDPSRQGIGNRGTATPIFAVDLPGVDGRIRSHRLSQTCDDAPASSPITLVGKAIVPPGAKRAGQSVLVQRNHFGHRIHQPLRWSGVRRSYNRGKSFLLGKIEKSMEPGKIITFRCRFEPAPGKFSYPNITDP